MAPLVAVAAAQNLMGHEDRTVLAQALRRAMRHPDRYLAALLAELPDEDIAAAVGADPQLIWRLRLAVWPRRHRWELDIAALATAIDASPAQLESFLVERGVERPQG